ncbi:hypothetical protein CSB45_08295 [candidate division KSB3 bacterium]|uniref:FMN-binding domain-containing protein n=1 Tax=candidate division KSB3 bacterium TaxID=2044937 RepID=A0A2G6E556_9BACT|nr:MAG: hypothetical protein CSB45_08295 [candidate division KSB3 bacterium]PIE29780.1 MAG: hypothetical protein CSA57_06920 [candidate division KSB3 bacterium]
MEQGIKTVRFMVVVSVVFIAILATVNEATRARIEKNFELEQAKSMLYAFDIFPQGVTDEQLSPSAVTADIPWTNEDVLHAISTQLKPVTIQIPESIRTDLAGTFLEGRSSLEVYEAVDSEGKVVAYGVPLYGKGLWGSIEAFGVISADLRKMNGIDFTKQSETPGLGARIMQEEYKHFFRNLDLSGFYRQDAVQTPIVMVKQKDQSNIEQSTNSIQAVTGATLTSQGVLKMVNDNLAIYIKILHEYQKQG